jgi:hypothetical protein
MIFLISFQEVGSPVGRIVKSEEFLKAAGPALVCDMCIFCVTIIKISVVSVSILGNKNISGTC